MKKEDCFHLKWSQWVSSIMEQYATQLTFTTTLNKNLENKATILKI